MYLEFFGLVEKPFGLTPDPKFLFLSEHHREALDHLQYGIHQKEGFVVISGDIGTGKTTLCRALLERLDVQEVTTALILNPMLGEEELLRTILEEFGLQPRGRTRKELIDELNAYLLEVYGAGKTAVLIIDEAQNLPASCLEQVRLLSNLETEKEKLIQIILVGSGELPAKLQVPELRHLEQRISVRYHLRPLNKKETRDYIQHRLAMAGAAGGIGFEQGAYRQIYRFSGGVPRLINMVGDRTLLAASMAESRKVKRPHVQQGWESLRGAATGQERAHFWTRRRFHPAFLGLFLLAIAASLLLLPGTVEVLEQHYLQQPHPGSRERDRLQGHPARVKIEPGTFQLAATARRPVKPAGKESEQQQEEKKNEAGVDGDLPQYLFKPPYIYTVHVNSFRNRKDAVERVRELKSRDFDAWVAWVDLDEKGVWYRVLLGTYKSKDEALALTRKLNKIQEFHDARQIAAYAGIFPERTGALR